VSEADAPEGFMLLIANAHDDQFRWRCAAACVQVAAVKQVTSRIKEDGGPTEAEVALAGRAVWDWTTVGEVAARYVAIAREMPITVNDEQLRDAIESGWQTIAAGMPAKE
jgi:hypothetical protein